MTCGLSPVRKQAMLVGCFERSADVPGIKFAGNLVAVSSASVLDA
jgi:hypothetical protein